MIQINSLDKLHHLTVPTMISDRLALLLIAGFDSATVAHQFWLSTHTVLWQLDSNESLPDDPLVDFALQYPECVMHIDDKWYLLLGIVSDSGQGVYVVFPNDTCVPRLQSLLAEMTHG